MSIKIGINGTTSFKNVIDVIVGTSETTKQDINFVKDWNETIIWQRSIPLTPQNTTITINPTSYSESGSQYPWVYTKQPEVTGVSVNGVTLDSSKYTVSYSENSSGSMWGTDSVTAYVRIAAKSGSGYSGYVDKNYPIRYTYKEDTIDIKDNCTIYLAEDSRTITNDQSVWTASKTDLTIDVSSVWLKSPSKLLTAGTDYTIAYEYPDNWKYEHDKEGSIPKNVKVVVTGKVSYSGSESKTYTVSHEYVIPSEHLITLFNPSTSSVKYVNMLDGNGNHLGAKEFSTNVTCTCFGGKYNYLFLSGGSVYRSRRFSDTWTNVGSVGSTVTACCYTGTQLVATTYGSPGNIVYSTDGSSWSTSSDVYPPYESISGYFTSDTILYANGKVYAPSRDKLFVSTDNGSSFKGYYPTGWTTAFKMVYGNGVFVMFGGGSRGNNVYTSSDPTVSITQASKQMTTRGTPCFGNGKFCILGSESTQYAPYVSTDGVNWTASTSTSNNYQDVCFVNGKFYMAVSNSGNTDVYTGTDGTTFSPSGVSVGHVYDRINY